MKKITQLFLFTICLSSSLNSFTNNSTHLQTVENHSRKVSNYTFATSACLMLVRIIVIDIAFFKMKKALSNGKPFNEKHIQARFSLVDSLWKATQISLGLSTLAAGTSLLCHLKKDKLKRNC